jgi:hypothetical protein
MVNEGQDPKVRPSASEILDDLMDWGGKVFQKVREEADALSTMGKLKLDLTSLKSKRGSEFKKLGMKVYHLLEHGKVEIPETESNVAAIEALAEQIRDREQQLKDLGNKPEAEVASTEQIEENNDDV